MAHLPFLRGKGGAAAHNPSSISVPGRPSSPSLHSPSPPKSSPSPAKPSGSPTTTVDQAFALALRQASLQTRTLTGDALAVQQKVAQLQALVKEDQAKVDTLTATLKQPNGTIAHSDDLDVAKAQLQLDNDELADANEQLARVSGDKRAQIQQELTARKAA